MVAQITLSQNWIDINNQIQAQDMKKG